MRSVAAAAVAQQAPAARLVDGPRAARFFQNRPADPTKPIKPQAPIPKPHPNPDLHRVIVLEDEDVVHLRCGGYGIYNMQRADPDAAVLRDLLTLQMEVAQIMKVRGGGRGAWGTDAAAARAACCTGIPACGPITGPAHARASANASTGPA